MIHLSMSGPHPSLAEVLRSESNRPAFADISTYPLGGEESICSSKGPHDHEWEDPGRSWKLGTRIARE